ncbi:MULTISPECIES: hypothetical protein [Pseudomonas]|uniref:hypothetical protein n=1 Tax=Pseudomonas TaxID=286 RepID=UPI0023D84F98|nr:hypothetical protein [Pseudomonas sp. PSE14]WEJ70111.1 hypothetical protein O6P39_15645 [Pseudomonas sp. PSE14]
MQRLLENCGALIRGGCSGPGFGVVQALTCESMRICLFARRYAWLADSGFL